MMVMGVGEGLNRSKAVPGSKEQRFTETVLVLLLPGEGLYNRVNVQVVDVTEANGWSKG